MNDYLEEYFTLPELPPLFALEISINVAPEARGKGLGSAILVAVQDVVKDRGFEAIYADIKEDNLASHKAFQRAGFKEIGLVVTTVQDTGQKVPIQQYVVDLFPSQL